MRGRGGLPLQPWTSAEPAMTDATTTTIQTLNRIMANIDDDHSARVEASTGISIGSLKVATVLVEIIVER